MSIDDLKNLGIIPKDIPDNILIDLCNRIGINNFSMQMSLNQEQISRIVYSSDVNNYKVKSSLSNSHQSVIAKYDELINGYVNILNGIKSRSGFDEEKQAISGLITKLQTEKSNYQKQINGFSLNNVSQYFDYGINNKISQTANDTLKNIAKATEEQQNQIDNKLDKLYKKLDHAKNSRNRTISGKLKASIRTRNLEAKINKLRSKQGKLRSRQSRIVGTNTRMYLDKMNKRFEKYFAELNNINDIIEDKKYMIDEIESSLNEQNDMGINAQNLQTSMLNANAFERVALNVKNRKNTRDMQKLQKHIERLQKKAGKVDLSRQYSEVFDRSYAR